MILKSDAKELSNRTELIEFLSSAVNFAHGKCIVGRLQKCEGDDTRLAYMRALAQLSTPLLNALRDSDLDEINRRLDEIEKKRR